MSMVAENLTTQVPDSAMKHGWKIVKMMGEGNDALWKRLVSR
jgi:hypothetical protein